MAKFGFWVEIEAKAGREEEVAKFLKSAQALAEKETGTLTWYAVKINEAKFAIFDTFADEKGRDAHLNGEIAKALFGKGIELLARRPEVYQVEVLASKVTGGVKAQGA